MINPTRRDIDRKVIRMHGDQAGRIIDLAGPCVIVDFNGAAQVMARDELVWACGKDREQ